MKTRTLLAVSVICAAFTMIFSAALPTTGQAQDAARADSRAFSAIAVQHMPDGSEQTGMIYKSGQNMRLEISADGQTSVQIMRGAESIAYLVDLAGQSYAEIHDPSIARAVAGASNPCPTAAEMQANGLTCQVTGQGLVSGVVTQHWEIQAPQSRAATHIEWDTGRRRALGQTWPDGTVLTMAFQAMDEIEGRAVEHWTSSLQVPDQPAALGGWWFDATLRVVLREEMPGGLTRQLRDIKVGAIAAEKFLPPPGFTLVEPQMQQPGPGQ